MTETTKEIFEKYEVRKTKKQKGEFIEYIKGFAEKNGYSCRVEASRSGLKARNIVIGDPDSAKVVYTAHYDTCPRLPFPNFITPKNIFIYILYQVIISAVLIGIPCIFGIIIGTSLSLARVDEQIASSASAFLAYVCLLALLYLMMMGPANPHTANDNTSGVTVLTDTMQALPEELRNKVAFIFFDLEEVGLVGSSSFYAAHKEAMKGKLIVNFDCVSDGEHILFVLKKKSKCYEDSLRSAFPGNDKYTTEFASKGVFYPSDQAKFPIGVGVAALKRSHRFGILYMNKIHTKNDTVYNEENISYLVSGAVSFAKQL